MLEKKKRGKHTGETHGETRTNAAENPRLEKTRNESPRRNLTCPVTSAREPNRKDDLRSGQIPEQVHELEPT